MEAFARHWSLLFKPRMSTLFIWWNLLFLPLDLLSLGWDAWRQDRERWAGVEVQDTLYRGRLVA